MRLSREEEHFLMDLLQCEIDTIDKYQPVDKDDAETTEEYKNKLDLILKKITIGT